MNMETKQFGGHLTEVKEQSIDGVNVGIVEGYIATWDVDRGNGWVKDQFTRGAFLDSIADHLKRRRKVRFKDHHGRTVGGWLPESLREDDRGLFGIAHVNLDVQQGAEAMSLIRQRVLEDFSIGFSADDYTIDGDLRTITKATIWEGSVVDEPMNIYANITGFKAVVPYQDLPLADRDLEWDSAEALNRVRELTDSVDEPGERYRQAFVWYDRENTNVFSGYKLPIADVVNGRLTAVPRAIFAAAAVMSGARGGVDIPEGDRPGVIRHIERYYAKMDMESPFGEDGKQFFAVEDVKNLTAAEIEKILKKSGVFSKNAAKYLASKFGVDNPETNADNTGDLSELFNNIKSMAERLKK